MTTTGKMGKFALKAFLACGLTVLATAYANHDASARTLKWTSFSSAKHPSHAAANIPFQKEVEEKSGGSLKVDFFLNGSLGKAADQLQIIESGVADIGVIIPNYTKGRFPLAELAELPFAFDSAEEATAAFQGILKDYIEKEFTSVKLLSLGVTAPLQVMTTKQPIKKVEDLDGLRLRGSDGARVLEKFGASIVLISSADTYLALDRSTLDGTTVPLGSMFNYKLEEVIKYANMLNLYEVALPLVMNLDTWNGLSPEEQKIVSAAAQNFAHNTALSQDNSTNEGRAKATKAGVEIIDMTAETRKKLQEAAKPFWDQTIAGLNEKGLPGDQILKQLIAARDAYRSSH
ncbi:MAG: TRAP transporter substrate-binding protein [Alphaproteobacteria bacterium]|nr:MAG: TRAP transporter substrate-binding protein [Alphaproteobacteria bacterium]